MRRPTIARDYLVRQSKADDLANAGNTNGFTNQILDANKLVFHARLDLFDKKTERVKVVEDTIKEVEPIVALYEKHFKAGIVASTAK